MTARAFSLLVLSFLAGGRLSADTIRLVDGKTIPNVQIVSEGLKEVAFKEGKDERTVPADTVLAVEYDQRPTQLGEAESYLLQDDPGSALEALDTYVQSVLEKPNLAREFKWAPASAAWRAVEVRQAAADLEGVKGAATRVLQNFEGTRFVPLAYLAKARAEVELGQAEAARRTLTDLAALVTSQSLPKRWELELRLAQAQADDKAKHASRRNEFERVASEAGALPAVKAEAQVLVGGSYLAEAAATAGGARELRTKAKQAFEEVLASEAAAPATVAAAHAGRGECLFLEGADADDKALLNEAILEFLRVATLYRDQGAIVARSLFYAVRCFDLLPDPRRKADMKRELGALFPNTSWAAEAKKY